MDRGQIHTLEAFIAGILIVSALLFASQATAVTPLSASTSNQHIENQQQTMAKDVLEITARDGSLQEALTYWNASGSEDPHFAHADPNLSTYSSIVGTDHPLNESFSNAFGEGVYAYNVELRYLTEDDRFKTTEMIAMGTPSDNAVTASRTVTLFDNDSVETGEELWEIGGEDPTFWAADRHDSSLFVVVEVRLTIWRM